ncbi:MAG: PAS domain S-box protein [Desulfamplus sp.]|nr:PAS domain S-box protein [Desulfamplus sp.]
MSAADINNMSIISALTDEIVTLKKQNAALEANYRYVFDGMTSCMAVYEALNEGQDFIFKDFNRAAEISSLISREDVIGKSVQEVFPGVIEIGLFKVFQRVYRTGIAELHPVANYQDERITLLVENYIYKLPTGEIVAIYDDITDRKQDEENLKNRMAELESINQMSRSVSMNVSLDEIIDSGLNQLMNTLASDLALIYLLEDNQMRLQAVKRSDNVPIFTKPQKAVLNVGECLCGIAARDANPIFSLNLHKDKRCTNSECKMAGIHSYASIPLMNREQLIGVVGVGSCHERNFAMQSTFLQSLASIIAVSIANTLLQQQVVIHAEQLMNQAVDHAEQLSKHADDLEKTVAERTVELKKFFNAVESSPTTIVITDVDGNIEYANPFFTQLTGYTREEAKGQNPRILKSGFHSKEFYEQMWKTLIAGDVWRGEICNRKKNGDLYWENVAISPLRENKTIKGGNIIQGDKDNSGNIIHFVGVKEDITARKKTQEIREDVERILRHDLKSPLNGIIGFPQVMMNDNNLTDAQKKYLKLIADAGRNMLDMINLSLTMYHIEMGTYKYTSSRFNLVNVLQQCILNTTSICDMKEISIKLSVDNKTDGLDIKFFTDRFSIETIEKMEFNGERLLAFSVFSNLIINAVEASPCKETVNIVIEPLFNLVTSDSLATHCNLSIRVTIHNQGAVPSDIRERFFDKYVTSGKPKGTGLGTYSAKLLAKSQGWDIEMKTSESTGTYLVITIL